MPDSTSLPAELRHLPLTIFSGNWKTPHVQGIAVDTKREFIYFSFTTMLLKTDLQGTPVGSVTGLTGHLGCLDFCDADGRVYGSLEYKASQAFYIAIFDVSKITEMDMDAERDGIMTTVYLQDVVDDFTADMDGNDVFDGDIAQTPDHRYGCSGIDGVAFGPRFGAPKDSPHDLHVAYGIYGNTERQDNDYQIILRYDTANWREYERPLNQAAPHHSGPAAPEERYFLFTGNTTYGVQNLDYDGYTGNWMVSVYRGTKKSFPNYPLYIIDGSKAPVLGEIKGQPAPESGLLLTLLQDGLYDAASGIYGWEFKQGQTGFFSFDNGYFYICHSESAPDGAQNGTIHLYQWTGESPNPFRLVEA